MVAEYEDRPFTWRVVEAGYGYGIVARLTLRGYEGDVPYGRFGTLQEPEGRVEAKMNPLGDERMREIIVDAVEGRPPVGYSDREREFRKHIDSDVAYLKVHGGHIELPEIGPIPWPEEER